MVKRKRAAPVGLGRLSMSLGINDPRIRRNAQGALQTDMNLDRTLTRDTRGRLGVKSARQVKDMDPSSATTEDLANKINELIEGQRASGQMEGGRKTS